MCHGPSRAPVPTICKHLYEKRCNGVLFVGAPAGILLRQQGLECETLRNVTNPFRYAKRHRVPHKITKKDTERCPFCWCSCGNFAPSARSRMRDTSHCYESLSLRETTSSSTQEHKKGHRVVSFFVGAPAGTRIPDPLIKSQMLYRLSYRGI